MKTFFLASLTLFFSFFISNTALAQTTQTCLSGQYWNGTSCVAPLQCNWSYQYMKMSTNTCLPKTNCTDTSNAEYASMECQGVRTATSYPTTSGAATATLPSTQTSCPSGQYWI